MDELKCTYLVGFAELKEGCSSFLLFLFAVNIHDFNIDIIQKFRVKLYRTAGGEKYLR